MTKEEFTIQKLVEMRNDINNRIENYRDGYFYICEIRSYGRNWKDGNIFNTYTLQELCDEYNGDDGIVDVYSNNPDLKIDNYGSVMFVPTEEDLQNWKAHTYFTKQVSRVEEELDKWDNRDDVPFKYRPMFTPVYTREDLEDMKSKLANFDMSLFVAPVCVKQQYIDNEQ